MIRSELAAELSRRELLQRAGALGARRRWSPRPCPRGAPSAMPDPALAADPNLADATLQAFFDTIIPGRQATRTDLGNPIHPQAIAGVDPEPGAVEADALLLAHHPRIGFDALEPAFLAELEARSRCRTAATSSTSTTTAAYAVCIEGLAFSNPTGSSGRRPRRSPSPPSAPPPPSATRPRRRPAATR